MMKLPKSITTVTTLSKIIAMGLFIALPFIGLLVGMGYQNNMDNIKCANEISKLNQRDKTSSPNTTATATNKNIVQETFIDNENQFEFKYPSNFQITEGLGQYYLGEKPIVELKSGTFSYLHNSIDGFFTVSIKENGKSECEYIPRGVIDTIQNKIVNGINFKVFSTSGVATGNEYLNEIYHHLKDNTCYELVKTIHKYSDGNTPEAIPIIDREEIVIEQELNEIISTFELISINTCIDSDNFCKGKPNSTDCTIGVWCDSEGRICGGQSCVGLGLGKCLDNKCVD